MAGEDALRLAMLAFAGEGELGQAELRVQILASCVGRLDACRGP